MCADKTKATQGRQENWPVRQLAFLNRFYKKYVCFERETIEVTTINRWPLYGGGL